MSHIEAAMANIIMCSLDSFKVLLSVDNLLVSALRVVMNYRLCRDVTYKVLVRNHK